MIGVNKDIKLGHFLAYFQNLITININLFHNNYISIIHEIHEICLTSWSIIKASKVSGNTGLTELISIGVKWFNEAWTRPSLMNKSTEDLNFAILKSHKSY